MAALQREISETHQRVIAQLTGRRLATPSALAQRRLGIERRQGRLWSVCYGTVRPRRRRSRRTGDSAALTDWYDSVLLLPVLGILVLSMTDGMLTLNLLAIGGTELNVIMDWLIKADPSLFAAVKMSMTSVGVVVLTACAPLRLLGAVRVSHLLYGFLGGYVALIGYELFLLSMLFD